MLLSPADSLSLLVVVLPSRGTDDPGEAAPAKVQTWL